MNILDKLITAHLNSIRNYKTECWLHSIIAAIYFFIFLNSTPIVAAIIGTALYVWQRIISYQLKLKIVPEHKNEH